MITLSSPTLTALQSCTGFTIVDNTNYNQSTNDPNGQILNNYVNGIRILKLAYSNGDTYLFSSVPVSGITTIPILTSITSTNSNSSSFTINTFEQGTVTATFLSIIGATYSTNTINVVTGSLVCCSILGSYQVFVALVNNPPCDFGNINHWLPITLDPTFGTVPSSYLSVSIPVTVNCYSSSIICIESNIQCAFCCDCCNGYCENENAQKIMNAMMLMAEIELMQQSMTLNNFSGLFESAISHIPLPSSTSAKSATSVGYQQLPLQMQATTSPQTSITVFDEYPEMVCNYSAALACICQSISGPCTPCSQNNSTQTYQLTQINIANAMGTIFSSDILMDLRKNVFLGKSICCDDIKSLVMFMDSCILETEGIQLSQCNFNCLDSVLNFNASSSPQYQLPQLATSRVTGIVTNLSNSIGIKP